MLLILWYDINDIIIEIVIMILLNDDIKIYLLLLLWYCNNYFIEMIL